MFAPPLNYRHWLLLLAQLLLLAPAQLLLAMTLQIRHKSALLPTTYVNSTARTAVRVVADLLASFTRIVIPLPSLTRAFELSNG